MMRAITDERLSYEYIMETLRAFTSEPEDEMEYIYRTINSELPRGVYLDIETGTLYTRDRRITTSYVLEIIDEAITDAIEDVI